MFSTSAVTLNAPSSLDMVMVSVSARWTGMTVSISMKFVKLGFGTRAKRVGQPFFTGEETWLMSGCRHINLLTTTVDYDIQRGGIKQKPELTITSLTAPNSLCAKPSANPSDPLNHTNSAAANV